MGESIIKDMPVVSGLLYGNLSAKSNLNERNKITNQASDIHTNGNLTLVANDDLNITGSNLVANNISLSTNEGNINIKNTVDSDYNKSESRSSKTTWSSVGAGIAQTLVASASSYLTAINPITLPSQKLDKIKANQENSKELPQKQELHQTTSMDETIISSNFISNNIYLTSAKDTNITSSNLTAQNNLIINSGTSSAGSTNILSASENDYTISFDRKKAPSIAATISNGLTKVVNDMMPTIDYNKKDKTKSDDEVKELAYDANSLKIENTNKINIASNLSANNNLNITSADSNLISSSNLSANDINLTSINSSTTITSAQDISTTSSESIIKDFKDFSTDYNRGRFSANSNSKVIEETVATQNITQISSNLNAKNNIAITSNKDLNILSSNLNAGTNPSATDLGSISLTSTNGNVNILALNNLQTTTTQTKEGTQTLSFGIGNSHIDTAYAEKDAIDAARNLADAKSQLNRIETKYKNNEATEEAVEDAKTNLTIALANLALAEVKLAASVEKSAASIGDLYTGFYGDVRLETTGTKTNSSTSSSNAIASNLTSNGNLTINSGLSLTNQITKDLGNTKILGSNLNSAEGDITITSKNNTTIQASKDTYKDSTTSKTWNESLTLSSSAGSGTGTAIDKIVTAAQIALGAGISKSQSDTNSTTYNNSSLTALNGNIKINSIGQSNINNSENPSNTENPNNTNNNQTTAIKGANLLAENITINTQGNLTLESLQNQYTQKSKSYGFNLGAGAGLANSGLNSVNLGINSSNSNNDRLWTDNQTTIIATNSVTINTKDNTNITGALIANAIVNNTQTNQDNQNNQTTTPSTIDLTKLTDLGNVTISTKTLTFKDLKDHDNQQSSNSSFSTNIGKGISTNEASNQTTTQSQPNPNQQKNYYPNGSTTIILGSQGQIKEQETKATIGQGVINTNSTITFNSNGDATTIDNSNSSSELTSNNETTNNQTINRDINNSQVITKDTTTAALDVNITIDNNGTICDLEKCVDELVAFNNFTQF